MDIRAFAASISGPAGYHSRSQRLLSDFLTVSQADPGSEVGRLCKRHAGIVSWPATQYQPEHTFLLVPGVGGSLPGIEAREFKESPSK